MSKSYNIISMAGAVLLLAGAVLQITRWELAPYLYTLGAVMFGYVQVMGNRYDGRNFIIKRLRRQQIFGAVALVFTGVLMFTMKRNEWIVCLSIAAVLELYTAFRIPQELEKENVKEPVSFLSAFIEAYLVKIGERGRHLLRVVRVLKIVVRYCYSTMVISSTKCFAPANLSIINKV